MEKKYTKIINPRKLDRKLKEKAISNYKGLYTIGGDTYLVYKDETTAGEIAIFDDEVNSHNPSDLENELANTIRAAKKFGDDLIVEFGTRNMLEGLTTAQIGQIVQDLGPVISALSTGSLNVAYAAMDSLQPTELLTQELIDLYKGKVAAFLLSLSSQ